MPPVAQETADRLPRRRGQFRALFARGLRAHNMFFVIIGLYALAYGALVFLHEDLDANGLLLGLAALLLFSVPFMFLSLVLMRFYHIARHVRPERPIAALAADIKAYVTDPRRLANGVPMFLLFVLFGQVFVDLKSEIHSLNGFRWDATFAQLDQLLHFGRQPWQWLQPLLGYAPITFLINVVYNMWFFVMWMSWIYFGFATQGSELRTRYFLTFFLTWIIGGNLMAIALSSAGPCFFGRVAEGPDPYAALMAYLHHTNESWPIWAVDLQEVLWQGHLTNGVAEEISAMPSMHNATALLFALAAWRVSPFWGRLMMLNAVLIFVGSIHLGWHYAVDGYVAWALCYAMWRLSEPLARWWHRQPPQQEFDRLLRETAA